MKKKPLIVLCMTGMLGAAIVWTQQFDIKPVTLKETPNIGYTTKDSSPLAKANVVETNNVQVTLEIETKQATISEEELDVQRQVAVEKVEQFQEKVMEEYRDRFKQARQLSLNEHAKKTLNIDAAKDLDVQFEEARARTRQKNKPELENTLATLGVAPDARRRLFETLEMAFEAPTKIDE